MVPNLRIVMNSSSCKNIHLGVEFSPVEHFGSQTDVQHLFIYVVLYFR